MINMEVLPDKLLTDSTHPAVHRIHDGRINILNKVGGLSSASIGFITTMTLAKMI
jgi:hypothetical protein